VCADDLPLTVHSPWPRGGQRMAQAGERRSAYSAALARLEGPDQFEKGVDGQDVGASQAFPASRPLAILSSCLCSNLT
jgi:hypothetical protein